MKAKINKQTLLGKGYNKGFVWMDRYSDTEYTDHMGRWARIGYYNGFMICWIHGYHDKQFGKMKAPLLCNWFNVVLFFPCSSNQGGDIAKFLNIEDAKKYAQEMFLDFKKLINK